VSRIETRNLLTDSRLALAYLSGLERVTRDAREKERIQRLILELSIKINPDLPNGKFGIRILEKNSQRVGQDCFDYVKGDQPIDEFYSELIGSSEVSPDPIEGSVVVYYNGVIPTHVGRVIEGKRVQSKWGYDGHVFEHLPRVVPLKYGEPVFFVPNS
jgi:hypothetical protein